MIPSWAKVLKQMYKLSDPVGEVQVNVPEAGWYELQATYFQRMGTSCLIMEWGTGGKMSLLPNAAYGH